MQHRGCNFPNSVLQTHNNWSTITGLKSGADVKKRAPVKFGLWKLKTEKCAVCYSPCVELVLLSTLQPEWKKSKRYSAGIFIKSHKLLQTPHNASLCPCRDTCNIYIFHCYQRNYPCKIPTSYPGDLFLRNSRWTRTSESWWQSAQLWETQPEPS